MQTAIRRSNTRAPTLKFDGSEEGVHPPSHHLLNGARPAIARVTREPHAEAVTMHDTAHFWGRNKDAVFEAFDAKEAVAGAIGADRPFDTAARLRPYRIGV